MKYFFIDILRLYKTFVSPFLPSACRFTPTCSKYATEAIEKYGVFRGTWLGLKRIFRCQPFSTGGHDPLL